MTAKRVLKIANAVFAAIATIISLLIVTYAVIMIYENTRVQNQAYCTQTIHYKPEVVEETVSVDELLENIPDSVAWITIDDTHIDYPVVQGEDDLYYAMRDVNKQPSLTGAVYLQSRNKPDFSQSYNLLFGHHMDNGAMFGDLTKYLDTDFFFSHLKGTLITFDKVYDIDVIAVIETDAYERAVYERTSLDWNGYERTILNNQNINVVNTNPIIKDADKFLVLSTCAGATTDGRVLLICKLTETEIEVEPVTTPAPTQIEIITGRTGDNAGHVWALLNLLCMILTILVLLPYLLREKEKKDRQKEENDPQKAQEQQQNQQKKKKKPALAGIIINVVLAVINIFIFILFEDMSGTMVIYDNYTIWMIIVLGLAVLTEGIATSREKKNEKDNKGNRKIHV